MAADKGHMLKTTTLQTRSMLELRVHAESLLPFVQAWLATVQRPDDTSLKIQFRLLQKQGAHLCPKCETPFRLENLQSTRTAYSITEIMRCDSCRTQFVLKEEHIA